MEGRKERRKEGGWEEGRRKGLKGYRKSECSADRKDDEIVSDVQKDLGKDTNIKRYLETKI